MRHDRRMLDQALDTAQTLAERDQLAALKEAYGAGQIGGEIEGDHAAEAAHLALGEFVLRMGFQAGVAHLPNLGMSLQPAGEFQGVLAMAAHSQIERLDAAQDEEAVERSGNRADGVVQEGESLAQPGVAFVTTHDGDAADHVGVAVQILGRRVHDDVETLFERPLYPR